MLKSYITHQDLLDTEASIADYLREDETDYSNQITTAFDEMCVHLKNQNKKLRLLCVPLALTDNTKSDEDVTERDRLVINVSSLTEGARIDLFGTDDESDESYTFIKSVTPTEVGEITEKFNKLFRFYKVVKSGTIEYTAELIETSYELPHKYLSLAKVYNSKRNEVGDVWELKYKDYMDLYAEALLNAMASYDANDNKTIEKTEVKRNNIVSFRL